MRMSQCVKKILFVAVLASMSSASLADWYVQKVYVKKIDVFQYQGSVVSRLIYEVAPDFSSKANFGCEPNDEPVNGATSQYQAAYWSDGTNELHRTLVGQLLAAQAQNIPVSIFFESSGCNKYHSYGYGGLGRMMQGVSVSSE